jgi:hypothetical protein
VGRINWLLVGTLGLGTCCLSPLFHTGYLGDDAGNSLVRGILRYYDITIFQLIGRDINAWLDQGRFYPLASVQIFLTFYLLPSLYLYKTLIIGLVLLNLVLFHQLVCRLFLMLQVSGLTLLIIIALFQFRIYHDPILAYAGLLQVTFGYLLVSLLFLCKYLESMRRRWLAVSVGAYLLGLLTYEITYPMFLLHIVCVRYYTQSWKRAVRTSVYFLAPVAACLTVCIFLRVILGAKAEEAYRPNTNIAVFLPTLSKQLFAGVPLSYSFTAGRAYLHSCLRAARALPALAVFLAGLALVWCAWRKVPAFSSEDRGRLKQPILAGLCFGFLLWILPGMLTSLSPRYQRELFWGVGQLPVYIEYYGVGLILASLMVIVCRTLQRGSRRWMVVAILLSATVACALSVTYNANRRIAQKFAWGWLDERHEVEMALNAGLADAVPDGSILIPSYRYPWWHDAFGAYFYCLNAGKKLHFAASIQRGPGIPLIQGGTSGNHVCLPSGGGCYEVFVPRTNPGYRYVFLCELAEPCMPGNGDPVNHTAARVWLFLRSRRAKLRADRQFWITGEQNGSPFLRPAEECVLLGEGEDWALYGLDIGESAVNARTLRVLPLPCVRESPESRPRG